VTDDGVGAPEDDEISPVAHLAERAGGLADVLQRHHGGSVSERRSRIDGGSETVGEGDGGALPFGAAAREAVDERRTGGGEESSGAVESWFE
jgi:hypothetical protein